MINGKINLKWIKNENLAFHKGIICIANKDSCQEYDPQIYLSSPLPDHIVSEILGIPNNPEHSYNLLTLLLTIDSTNYLHIMNWIKNFGFLEENSCTAGDEDVIEECQEHEYHLISPDLQDEFFDEFGDYKNSTLVPITPVDNFVKDIQHLKFSALLLQLTLQDPENEDDLFLDLVNRDDSFILFLIDNYIFSHYDFFYEHKLNHLFNSAIEIYNNKHPSNNTDFKLIDPQDPNDILQCKDLLKNAYLSNKKSLIIELVEFIFQIKIGNIFPFLSYSNNTLGFTYNFISLIHYLYYVLAYQATIEKPIQPCQSRTCSNYFAPSRKDQTYCCETCKNRAKQQRLRDKRREEKELKDNGHKKSR